MEDGGNESYRLDATVVMSDSEDKDVLGLNRLSERGYSIRGLPHWTGDTTEVNGDAGFETICPRAALMLRNADRGEGSNEEG
ncbi:unnamed protein product [Dovyalis caffra]|uniref:Uncharacterized protein n=1 Tax=Dovyalis caffra TaxID=77055 RepID=A0AAV1QZG1_9ROSI|nr:unnamed protein product [Dovyalis caffra]